MKNYYNIILSLTILSLMSVGIGQEINKNSNDYLSDGTFSNYNVNPITDRDLGDYIFNCELNDQYYSMRLDWYEGYLWFMEYHIVNTPFQNTGLIYKLNPETCEIEESIYLSDATTYDVGDIEWIDGYLWISELGQSMIHKYDNNGNLILSFSAPNGGTTGITWDGEYLWAISFQSDLVYQIDSNSGDVVYQIPALLSNNITLDFDNGYLWSIGRNAQMTYKFDPFNNIVITSFDNPFGPYYASLTFDGQYLWTNYSYSQNLIYKIDIEYDNVSGCTDPEACNYDSDATEDDGSCAYEEDCAGECGGDAVVDECGVCGGENADMDCAGECGGTAEQDECGVCEGSGPEFECEDDSIVCGESDCPGYCEAPVCLSLINVYSEAGELDIHMTNQAGCSYCTDPVYNDQEYCEYYGDDGDGDASWEFETSIDEGDCASQNGSWFNGHVGGFQFELPGVTITGASGGTASEYFAIVNTTSSIILGFDLSGGTIPPGEGILTQVTFTDYAGEGICFGTDPAYNVISDAIGGSVSTEWGECFQVDDCEYDECGVCNGPGAIYECGCNDIPDGLCDCAGNVADCAGECGGTAEADECGVCNGDGSTCEDFGGVSLEIQNVDTGSGTLDIYMSNYPGCSYCEDSLYNKNSDDWWYKKDACEAPWGGDTTWVAYDPITEEECFAIPSLDGNGGWWFDGHVAGFQFELSNIEITGASSGTASDADFTVDTWDSQVLGFSFTGATIPPGSGILIQVSFSNFDGEICFGDDTGSAGNNVISGIGADGWGLYVAADWGECACPAGLDECGVCGGDDSSCLDCADVPNGDSVMDNCGTCDNDSSNDCVQDCNGEWGGTAVEDICGECDGGGTYVDECGVCDGPGAIYECGCNGFPDGECDCAGNVADCAGECGGSAEQDECGVCDGANYCEERIYNETYDGPVTSDAIFAINNIDSSNEVLPNANNDITDYEYAPITITERITSTARDGSVLVIRDNCTEQVVSDILTAAGYNVTVTEYNDGSYVGTPNPNDFNAVVLLNGCSWDVSMPTEGQDALRNYVEAGGGILVFSWTEYEAAFGYDYMSMLDLIPLNREGGNGNVNNLYTVIDDNHPVTNGISDSFNVSTGGNVGYANSGTVLVTSPEAGDVVVAKEWGDGKIVGFASAGAYDYAAPFESSDMQVLLRNSVDWVSSFGCFVIGPDADCAGECFGDAGVDDCGVCDGANADMDCAGVCDGDAVEDCAGECGGDAELDECGVCEGPGAIYECGCDDFPSSNVISAAPEGYYAEGNAVIAVQLILTGEIIGEGDEEALAFDSILLTFLDGSQEVVNRPEDWNYDDWRGTEPNHEFQKPEWAESNRDWVPWTIWYWDVDAHFSLMNDNLEFFGGFYLGEEWDYSESIYFSIHYFDYSGDFYSYSSGGTGMLEIQIGGETCDCEGNTLDCTGECGGTAVEDNCGVCDNDPENDCVQDCLGVWGGDAVIDACGVCDGGIDSFDDCADISVSPDSLSQELNSGDMATQTLTISNEGGSELEWNLNISENRAVSNNNIGFYADETRQPTSSFIQPDYWQDNSQNNNGGNDNNYRGVGDVINAYTINGLPCCVPSLTWANENLYVITYYESTVWKYDPQTASFETFLTPSEHGVGEIWGITYDGQYIWITNWAGNVYGYDLSGNQIGSFSSPLDGYQYITWDDNYFIIHDLHQNDLIYRIGYDGSIIESFYNSNPPENLYDIVWVADHAGGELWAVGYDGDYAANLYQYSLSDGNVELVQAANLDGYYFYDVGLTHDGTDLWNISFPSEYLLQIDDGIEESYWLSADPTSGTIPAGSSETVQVTFDATDLSSGDYSADILITSNDPDESEVTVPVSLITADSSACNSSPVCISIQNVDTLAGTLDIYMENSEPVGGFQFEIFEVSMDSAFGGSAAENDFSLSVNSDMVLGFSMTGATIPVGSGLLTSISFSNYEGGDVCFGDNPINNAIADAAGYELEAQWNCWGDDTPIEYYYLDNGNYVVESEPDSLNYYFNNGYQPEPYYDQNGNGEYDEGEPFDDMNGNGIWDIALWDVYYHFENDSLFGYFNGELGWSVSYYLDITNNQLCIIEDDYYQNDNGIMPFHSFFNSDNREINCTDLILLDQVNNIISWEESWYDDEAEEEFSIIVSFVPAIQGCLDTEACNFDDDANTQLYDLSLCDYCEEIPEEFTFNQSSSQAFYFVMSATDMYTTPLESGDWIGLFNGDVCVGSREWPGEAVDIPTMGDDGFEYSEGYLQEGDIPTFKIYDASEDMIYTAIPSENFAFADAQIFFVDELNGMLEYALSLDAGANLVSFYTLPDDNSIENVIGECPGNMAGVLTEGIAAACIDGQWIGTLIEIDLSDGYWILADNPDTLTGYGTNYDPDRVYDLHYGANLISYSSLGEADLSSSIPDDVEDLFLAILSEGSAAMNTEAGWVGSLTTFDAGVGYWTIVSDDLSFSYEAGSMARSDIRRYIETRPSGSAFEVAQSPNQAFYFVDTITLDEGGIEDGDWLLSYNGHTLTGIRQWQGVMIDIPAMGLSENSGTEGYLENGDVPTFTLFKQSTGEYIPLGGDIPTWTENGMYILGSLSEMQIIPNEFVLNSAYPNPFNPVTTLEFGIPVDGDVSIEIYNLQGRLITILVSQNMKAGYHSAVWNADNHSSGMYFVKMVSGTSTGSGASYIKTQKLMLVK